MNMLRLVMAVGRVFFYIFVTGYWYYDLCYFVVGCKRMLICRCEHCEDQNYTCLTDGACLVTIYKVIATGEIMWRKSCTNSENGDRLLCYNPPTPTSVAHCCYYNMCNTDITLTFPTTSTILPSKSVRGKWLLSYCK